MALVTLTFRERDHQAVLGAARDFWRKVRQTWLGTRYFCWLELHRDGQFHYHAIWVNPPGEKKIDLLPWVDRHWGHGRTQVRFRQISRGDDGLMDYVLKYTNKMRGKAYQQIYDEVPRELRTFMSQRFDFDRDELLAHTDHELWRWAQIWHPPLRNSIAVLVHYADWKHDRTPSGCQLLSKRHRARAPGAAVRPAGASAARDRARRALRDVHLHGRPPVVSRGNTDRSTPGG